VGAPPTSPLTRSMHDSGRFIRSHSRMRTTRHLSLRSARFWNESRSLFLKIFADQKRSCVLGCRKHLGQPCQKHPSMKIAILDSAKTKSGLTCGLKTVPSEATAENVSLIVICRRQPTIPDFLNLRATAVSVRSFPIPRMQDMMAERRFFEILSNYSGSFVMK
jgi:hypothetical protein